MSNRNGILLIAGGLVIAGGIVSWLVFGSKPINISIGNGVNVQTNVTMKDSVISRDKDGVQLWEFHVKELQQDKKNNKAVFKGITGKVFRKDGSWIDIVADSGTATLNKTNNDFMVQGNVKAIGNTGGKIYANKVIYIEKTKFVQASGNVRMQKDEYTAYGDIAETTTEMEKFKLKGHAKVEKGGKWDDK